MNKVNIKCLYYITHIGNLPSILNQGILSHQKIEEDKVLSRPIYDNSIVNMRQQKPTPQGDSLWNYANL